MAYQQGYFVRNVCAVFLIIDGFKKFHLSDAELCYQVNCQHESSIIQAIFAPFIWYGSNGKSSFIGTVYLKIVYGMVVEIFLLPEREREIF